MPTMMQPLRTAQLPTQGSLMEWALWYASQGIPVFPCHGKVPAIPRSEGGQGFKDATTQDFIIEQWWKRWPDANIATATGHQYWVLDCDPRNGGDQSMVALEHKYGELPESATVLTGGGGTHTYFKMPANEKVRHHTTALGHGIDVQALGGYVILPPSIHPDTGREYAWDLGRDLDSPGICAAPDWLLALVSSANTPFNAPTSASGEPIYKSVRENTLMRISGGMRRQGCTYEEILIALEAVNARCKPPLRQVDIQRMALSSTRYAPEASFVHNGNGHEVPVLAKSGGEFLDAVTILNTAYPMLQWIIKGLIPEGLTFFAGSPKSSKTYLAYSLALALALQAARDELWLGQYDVKMSGPVVYLTLEDDAADTKQRLLELYPKGLPFLPEGRLIFHHGIEVPQLGLGLTEWLESHIIPTYNPALIVLDPISYLYANTKKSGDQFAEVREMLLPLRTLGRQQHIGIIGVDHRRKKNNDDVDVFETLYGSNAKIAIADSLLLIVRDDKEVTVHCLVRKGSDQTLTLGFEFAQDGSAEWSFKGSSHGLVDNSNYGDLRKRICLFLMAQPGAISLADIIAEMQVQPEGENNIRKILQRLVKANEIRKEGRGMYVWCR